MDSSRHDVKQSAHGKVRNNHSSVPSQSVSSVKNQITRLYELPEDPGAVVSKVQYLLQDDRFMYDPKGYEVCCHNMSAPW